MTKMKSESETTKTNAGQARDHTRRSVLWPAVIDVNGHTFNCQIWNLSLGGVRIRFDIPLKEGSDVILRIPNRNNAEILSRIAWQREDTVGLLFMVPPSKIREIFHDRLHILGLDGPEVVPDNSDQTS